MKITKEPERTMMLRVALAEGTVGEERFDLGYLGSSLVWYFHDEGRYYTILFKDLTEAVLKYRERG